MWGVLLIDSYGGQVISAVLPAIILPNSDLLIASCNSPVLSYWEIVRFYFSEFIHTSWSGYQSVVKKHFFINGSHIWFITCNLLTGAK